MRKILLAIALFPSLLLARDFSGEWSGKLFSASAAGSCTVTIRIAHTADFLVVSPRTYVCDSGVKYHFGLLWLKQGAEVGTAAGIRYRPLLHDGKEVGHLLSDGRFGQIQKTPEGSMIGR